jgi:hypothetical protein
MPSYYVEFIILLLLKMVRDTIEKRRKNERIAILEKELGARDKFLQGLETGFASALSKPRKSSTQTPKPRRLSEIEAPIGLNVFGL